ncbi:MAG: hypothetical protein ABI599_08900 [Flavobacteriales bacterium]
MLLQARVAAQASLELGGGVYNWNMQPSDEDSRPDELSRTPGPGWSLSLIYRQRPDSSFVGLMFGLLHERREVDVDFAYGGLGGGSSGREYVRMNTTCFMAGLNVRLSKNGGHWLRPALAARVANQNVASGYVDHWSMDHSNDGTDIYRNKKGAGYAAPLFFGIGWGIVAHIGDRWLIDVEPNASVSVPLPAFVHEPSLGSSQYQAGVRMAFGLVAPRLFGPGVRTALRKDRERRLAPGDR